MVVGCSCFLGFFMYVYKIYVCMLVYVVYVFYGVWDVMGLCVCFM